MIELSFTKLLLLAVIALVVLGPEKLPKAARVAGAMLRRVRLGWESVRSEVERELEVEEIRHARKQAVEHAEALEKAAKDATRSTRDSLEQVASEMTGEGAGAEKRTDATRLPHDPLEQVASEMTGDRAGADKREAGDGDA